MIYFNKGYFWIFVLNVLILVKNNYFDYGDGLVVKGFLCKYESVRIIYRVFRVCIDFM